MIKRYDTHVLLTYPPQRKWYWWCGGCDHYIEGGIEQGITIEDYYLDEWKKVNEGD